MKKEQLFRCAETYESPRVKTVAMHTRRIICLSGDGYGDTGQAGHDGDYDPYNEENDL